MFLQELVDHKKENIDLRRLRERKKKSLPHVFLLAFRIESLYYIEKTDRLFYIHKQKILTKTYFISIDIYMPGKKRFMMFSRACNLP